MLLLLVSISLIASITCAPTEELIVSLPNLVEPMRSLQYSGYLNISDTKSLYYWYIESENDPSKDPVVLWLNGGPGCSSLEGLFVEMGPFRTFDYGKTLERNPWTWNRYASIIYLDAPAGVGFSIRRDNSTLWNYTDDEVADDNLKAITMWFEKFPERKNNTFYVAGESYGGTYVPMLSDRLVKNQDKFPQFAGMFIGNGCVDDVLNTNTGVSFNYNHGFTDETTYRKTLQKCCSTASYIEGCNFYQLDADNGTCTDDVDYLIQSNYYTGLDPYFLYFSCYLNPSDQPSSQPLNYPSAVFLSHLKKRRNSKYDQVVPSCAHYNDSTVYLQLPEVRKALHIPDYVQQYDSCSTPIAMQYDMTKTHHVNQMDTFKNVIAAKKRVMLFNGDVDSICNGVHNAQFVENLNLTLKASKTVWEDASQLPPTIGLITQYEGLDFLTVKGAGHFVSSTKEKPKEALQLFVNFINNQNYSTMVTSDTPVIGSTALPVNSMPTTTTTTTKKPNPTTHKVEATTKQSGEFVFMTLVSMFVSLFVL